MLWKNCGNGVGTMIFIGAASVIASAQSLPCWKTTLTGDTACGVMGHHAQLLLGWIHP